MGVPKIRYFFPSGCVLSVQVIVVLHQEHGGIDHHQAVVAALVHWTVALPLYAQ